MFKRKKALTESQQKMFDELILATNNDQLEWHPTDQYGSSVIFRAHDGRHAFSGIFVRKSGVYMDTTLVGPYHEPLIDAICDYIDRRRERERQQAIQRVHMVAMNIKQTSVLPSTFYDPPTPEPEPDIDAIVADLNEIIQHDI